MRAVATAIESYRVDENRYPPPYGVFRGAGCLGRAFHARGVYYFRRTRDPFAIPGGSIGQVPLTYELVNSLTQQIEKPASRLITAAPEGQVGAWWWIASRGPDGRYGFQNPANDRRPVSAGNSSRRIYSRAPGFLLCMIPRTAPISLGNLYPRRGAIRGFCRENHEPLILLGLPVPFLPWTARDRPL
jgi:hypothetical protein